MQLSAYTKSRKATVWLCLPCGYIGTPQRNANGGKPTVCAACGSPKIIPAANQAEPEIISLKGGTKFARFKFLLKILIIVFAVLVIVCLYALKQQITPP